MLGPLEAGERDDEIRDRGSAPEITLGRAGGRDPDPGSPRTLTVMTWNIAYARGPSPDNAVNRPLPQAALAERLRQMGALIRAESVDVLLLQEVDFASRRTRFLDQLELLAHHAGFRYSARAVSWDARYVPYPYWPPLQHFGRIVSGGAVLSRWPIVRNRVLLFAKPAGNPWWYNAFYLFRYAQRVTLCVGQRQVRVINAHLEAFDRPWRREQAVALRRVCEAEAGDGIAVVLGGDLNTVPPEARQKHGFADEPRDDYRDDPTLAILRDMPGFTELVPPERYRADEQAYFTFPAALPNRRLDYVFVDQRCVSVTGMRIVPTMAFSDHRPVVATLLLDDARS